MGTKGTLIQLANVVNMFRFKNMTATDFSAQQHDVPPRC